jgi:fructose-1,6-bisphosphatase/inositol monophosphatase family enzyme
VQIHSIESVLDDVRAAAEMALEAQRSMSHADRAYKGDGSVLTETDKRIEDHLSEQIAWAHPRANILGEETVWAYDPAKPYTFAIDPIDGTDVYSQGMPGWCVSVGLLDRSWEPIAGIVCAPGWGLELFADVGKPATCNGEAIQPPDRSEPLSIKSNVMAYSRIHAQVDWSRYPGKIRSIGSAALHLCFPLIYPAVVGAVEGRGGHIWDIAGAHAVVRSHGFDLEYLGGGTVNYAVLRDGSPTGDNILSGSREQIRRLRRAPKRVDG